MTEVKDQWMAQRLCAQVECGIIGERLVELLVDTVGLVKLIEDFGALFVRRTGVQDGCTGIAKHQRTSIEWQVIDYYNKLTGKLNTRPRNE